MEVVNQRRYCKRNLTIAIGKLDNAPLDDVPVEYIRELITILDKAYDAYVKADEKVFLNQPDFADDDFEIYTTRYTNCRSRAKLIIKNILKSGSSTFSSRQNSKISLVSKCNTINEFKHDQGERFKPMSFIRPSSAPPKLIKEQFQDRFHAAPEINQEINIEAPNFFQEQPSVVPNLLQEQHLISSHEFQRPNFVSPNMSSNLFQEQPSVVPNSLQEQPSVVPNFYQEQPPVVPNFYQEQPPVVSNFPQEQHTIVPNVYQTQSNNHDQNKYNLNVPQKYYINSAPTKLPVLNLPTFSGNYLEWVSFRDMFSSIIDANPQLSDVQKFHYLKLSLVNEAASLLISMPSTSQNYKIAWIKLNERFNKPSIIIENLIEKFFKLQNVQKGCNSLRHLIDSVDEIIRSLNVLGDYAKGRDPWMIYFIKQKLDYESQKQWASKIIAAKEPSFEEFLNFLEERASAMELLNFHKFPNTRENQTSHKSVKSYQTTVNLSCPFCESSHLLFQCKKFKSLKIDDRRQQASNISVCFNCLKKGHAAVDCKSPHVCHFCQKKHHSLLHMDTKNADKRDEDEKTVSSNSGILHSTTGALLATCQVFVLDKHNRKVTVRLLLDNGSQISFISKNIAKKLNLPYQKTNISVSGVANSRNVVSKFKYRLSLLSIHDRSKGVNIQVFSLPEFFSLPEYDLDIDDLNIDHLQLADPEFFKSAQIDILLGMDYYHEVIQEKRQQLPRSFWAQQTIFGWVISGGNIKPNNSFSTNLAIVEDINFNLENFWKIEDVPSRSLLTEDEVFCEKLFQDTYKRLSDGRFEVSLPFKSQTVNIGESLNIALSRFYWLEKRFAKNPTFKFHYLEFMKEMEDLGFMVKIKYDDKEATNNRYYLPHHGIIHQTVNRTKFRVVFNASAKTSNGRSINDELLAGPNLQNDLFSIIARFRTFPYVITTDIEKMFLQIRVNQDHCRYQRIVWRDSPDKPIEHYQLSTVVFGFTSSPFLAMKSIRKLAEDSKDRYPLAASALTQDILMDDVITGKHSIEEITTLQQELIELTSQASFNLKKWVANDIRLLENIPIENCAFAPSVFFQNDTNVKTLGLYWSPSPDEFSFKVNLLPDCNLTKRNLLSESSKFYDPFGWIAPTILLFKLIFQELWLMDLAWDNRLPVDIQNRWLQIRSDMHLLQNIRIPRFINYFSGHIDLLGFSDASEKSYGAVVYARTLQSNGQYRVSLFASKSRVAPIKPLTIPRLELCGALLLSKLLKSIQESLYSYDLRTFCWSDSIVVLHWLQLPPNRLKQFVSNRVIEIHSNLPSVKWSYVESSQNPADLASRGVLPSVIINSKLWWEGPEWIIEPNEKWLTFNLDKNFSDIPELKKDKIQVHHTTITNFDLIKKYSKIRTLIHVMCYCQRFINRTRKSDFEYETTILSCEELDRSLKQLIKIEQLSSFPNTLDRLLEGKRLSKKDPLLSLTPFIDSDGVLRVGGRLSNTDLSYDRKHPMILPKNSHISDLLIENEHERSKHMGTQTVISNLRQRFWIIGIRSKARKLLGRCVICFKFKPRPAQQQMGLLPPERIDQVRAFFRVGIDFAGPFYIKPCTGRGRTSIKSYVSLFVCLSTKAIHLECVLDLTADSCLAAISRFVSRRGRPSEIWSDNGTNFVRSKHFLDSAINTLYSENFNNTLTSSLADQGIIWKFIPPHSPEFGGLWESSIKSCKYSLFKCMRNEKLVLDEFNTLLTQVEAALNSRPYTYIFSDDDNLEILTPSHFLTGTSFNSIPELSIPQKEYSLKGRWLHLQKIFSDYWSRWSNTYINSLFARKKNFNEESNLKIGQIGLVKDIDKPPFAWPLGRIIDIFHGPDNKVRVISIELKNKTIFKKINK